MPKSKFPATKYQHKLREYSFLRLIYKFIESITNIYIDINSYPLFASMDTGIYPMREIAIPCLKPQLSLFSGPNHCINTVLLGHIAAARELDGGGDHHCDVINYS